MTMTADDIDFSANRAVSFVFASTRFASQPGWDEFFGYGRANAAQAVATVAAGDVPPEADLLTPDWWTTLDPVRADVVPVVGSAAASHAASYGYELAFGCGVQPTEDRFHPIANGTSLTRAIDGETIAFWSTGAAAIACAFDPAAVPETAPSGTASPNDTPDAFTVTLRLRVTDDQGRRAESRRTVYVHHDPDLLRRFPVALGGSGEASPLFAPLAGAHGPRARESLLTATSDGTVFAFRPNGSPRKGWPVHTDPLPLHTASRAFTSGALGTAWYEALGGGLAAGDLDGDGHTEVVAGSLGGKLYVWDRRGRRRTGFPVTTDPHFSAPSARDEFNRLQRGILAPPVLVDLDGDGKLEIVAGAMDRHVYVWRADGTMQPGWPVLVVDRTQMASIDPVSGHVVPNTVGGQPVALQGTKIVSTPAVGSLRHDGKLDIVVGTNEEYRETPSFSSAGNTSLQLFGGLGLLSLANGRVYAIPAGGNADPDGAGNPAGPYLAGWPAHVGTVAAELLPWIEGVPGAPALADVDGDGTLEVGISTVAGPAYVLRADGSSFYGTGPDGKPLTLPTDKAAFGAGSPSTDGFASVPSLGSGTFAPIGPGGGVAWIQTGAGFGRLLDANLPAEQLPHDVHLAAYDAGSGTFLPAFPQLLDDLVFLGEPSVADVNGDGQPEILVGSGGYLVHAIAGDGSEAAGWPKFTGGWIIAAPAVSTRFTRREVVAVTTREGALWVWQATGAPGDAPWPRYHHDAQNTGLLD
jgi:hypothetical protein